MVKKLTTKKLFWLISIGLVLNTILILVFEPPCPWKKNFNIDCAGCGATRMIKAIFELKFYQAFRFNPLLFCFFIFGIVYLVYILVSKIMKKSFYRLKDRDLLIILVLVIVFTILRNIPMFDYLKPTILK